MATAENLARDRLGGERWATLLRLAWPTMLARSGILLMALADIIMVGHYDARELAYASLGLSVFIPLLVTGIGLLMGVMTLVSQSHGRGDPLECGAVFRRALPWALALGAAGALICAFGGVWLRLLGQTPDLARGGGAVALALAPGLAAQLLYVACSFLLEGTRRPLPGLVAMIVANLLNIGLNWVLIFGHFGAPALGAVGSAIATALVRVFLLAALLGYVLTRPDAGRYGLERMWSGHGFWGPGGWTAGARMRRLGWASGVSVCCETTAYAMVTQFAGWISADALAAYAVAYNVEGLCFMVALGLGSATAALVGGAIGRGDAREAAAAGFTALGAVTALMAGAALVIWLGAPGIARLYTPEPRIAVMVAGFLPLTGMVILFDGAQLVMGQAVRAMGDAWSATRRYMLAFWAILVPAAYVFGVTLELGGRGLLIGVLIGCAASLALQAHRFRALVRQTAAATQERHP